MTSQEFEAWMRQTERSKKGWQVDEVLLANRGEHLMYRGGQDGTYVAISTDNIVQVGHYEGALPHIGEAIFTPRGTKEFDSKDDAFSAVAGATGISGLMALLIGDGRNPFDAYQEFAGR